MTAELIDLTASAVDAFDDWFSTIGDEDGSAVMTTASAPVIRRSNSDGDDEWLSDSEDEDSNKKKKKKNQVRRMVDRKQSGDLERLFWTSKPDSAKTASTASLSSQPSSDRSTISPKPPKESQIEKKLRLLNGHQQRQKENAEKILQERRSAKKLTKDRKCSIAASLSRQLCSEEEDLSVVTEATTGTTATTRKGKEKSTPMRPKKTLAKIKVETPGLTDLYGKVPTDTSKETKSKEPKTGSESFSSSNQSLDKSDKSIDSNSSVEKPLHRRRTSKSPIRPRRRSREGLDVSSTHHRTRRVDPLARSSHVSAKDNRSRSVGPVAGRRSTNETNVSRSSHRGRGRSTSVSAIERPERSHQDQTKSKHRGRSNSVAEKRAHHVNQQADLAKQRGRSSSLSQRRAQQANQQAAKRSASQSVTRGGSRRDHQGVGKASEKGGVASHQHSDVSGRRLAYKSISKSGHRHSYQDLNSADLKVDKHLLANSSVCERRSSHSDRWAVDGNERKVDQLSKTCHGRGRRGELTRGLSVPRRMNSIGDKKLEDDTRNAEAYIPYSGKPMSPQEYQETLLRLEIDSAKAKSKGSSGKEKEDEEPEIIELGRRRRTSDGLDLSCSRHSGRQRRRSSMGAL